MPDFYVRDHGSLALFTPNTDAARAWLDEHIDPDNSTYWCESLVVERRYVRGLVNGIRNDDLTVE